MALAVRAKATVGLEIFRKNVKTNQRSGIESFVTIIRLVCELFSEKNEGIVSIPPLCPQEFTQHRLGYIGPLPPRAGGGGGYEFRPCHLEN